MENKKRKTNEKTLGDLCNELRLRSCAECDDNTVSFILLPNAETQNVFTENGLIVKSTQLKSVSQVPTPRNATNSQVNWFSTFSYMLPIGNKK